MRSIVESHVLVHEHVAKVGQALQPAHELGIEARVPRQMPHGLGVVLEPVAATSGQLAGQVDDELAQRQQRIEHVVWSERSRSRSCPRPTRGRISRRWSRCRRSFRSSRQRPVVTM